jgi:cyclopropane fatty-acyl-phospholipid synthase-like methyltransferase
MYSQFIDLKEFKNKKILEVGCGAGGKSVYIAEKYNSDVV